MKNSRTWTLAGALLAMASFVGGANAQTPTVDGSLDFSYGFPKVWQTVQTEFGSSTTGQINVGSGSELVAGYGTISGGRLNLFFSGNLETSGNRIWIFIDSIAGGQNRLRGDNVGFASLVRQGDSGGTNGLTFDSNFAPDYVFSINANTSNVYVDFSTLPTNSGGTGVYVGQSSYGSGTLSGGTNALLLAQCALNNSSTTGVSGGTSSGQVPNEVTTGLELTVSASALGITGGGPVKVFAYISSGDGSFLSNQFLPDVGANGATVGNFGEPRGTGNVPRIDFNASPGTQYFFVHGLDNGRLAVARYASTSSTASAVAIQEYAKDTAGQISPITITEFPSTGTGTKLTGLGGNTNDGQLNRTTDGRFLVFQGYNVASGSTVTGADRVYGLLSTTGAFSTSAQVTEAAASSQLARGSASFDGTQAWSVSNGALRLNSGSTSTSITATGNMRATNVVNNRLWVSGSSFVGGFDRLPTAASTLPSHFSATTISGATDFAFTDSRTCYITTDGSGTGLEKWTNNGTAWSRAYQMSVALGGSSALARHITAERRAADGKTVLYVATADNRIHRFVDEGSAAATIATGITLTTNSAGGVFRGVELSNLPVNLAPVATGESYSASEDTPLSIAAPGVLGNDTDDGLVAPLSAVLVSAMPISEGSVVLNSNGGFVFTPAANFSGTTTFTYKANDGALDSNIATVTIMVAPVNDDPILDPIGNQTVGESQTLSFNLTSTDVDGGPPAYSSSTLPANASLTGNTFSFTPDETQGGQVYTVTFTVSDGNGGSDNETITITVNEVNAAPVLAGIGNQTVDELVNLSFTASATDSDDPANTLTYSLVGAPVGASINPSTGAFSWTPTESQGPGTYTFTVKVTDGGSPALSDEEEITVTVNEVNAAPVLAGIGNQSVDELVNLSFTASATDSDEPAQALTYSLVGAPVGASINPSTGVFSWTPTEAQGPGTYTFTVKVTDDGTTALSDEEEITVTVNEVNVAPVLAAIGNQSVDELVNLSFTASATDSDEPANTLTYSLVGAPSGATINPSTGAFSWTPTEAQGPGTYTFDVVVSDGQSPALTDSETITVTVNEVNVAPVLAAIGNQSVDELVNLSFTASATDSDEPAQALTYSLVGAPSGATINPSTGVFSWTPTEAQGPGTYTFTVKVTDDGTTALSDEEEITVTVNEVNVAPVLAAIGNQSVDELVNLSFTASATDSDDPANTLAYSLVGAPSGATINPSTGVFSWTPTEAQGPGTYSFTVKVTDDGSPALSDEEEITVTVNEVNVAPVADNQTVSTDEETAVNITLTGTDSDLPAQTLSYSVVSGPSHGTLTGTAPNLVYTPGLNFAGTDSFTFKVNDGTADSNTATVTINVNDIVDMNFSVHGSPAPNFFGSPSWNTYRDNAMNSLENGLGDIGDRTLDPTAYNQVTQIPWKDVVVSGFPSWRGLADPTGAFASELGNRLHFGLSIKGNGTRFSLDMLEYVVTSSDPNNDLGDSFAFAGGNYSANRKGIDYGPDRVKGTTDDIIVTSGSGSTLIDEFVYVGFGNAYDATFATGLTNQDKLNDVRCYVETIAPVDVVMTYKINNGMAILGQGTTTVTIVPTNSVPVANNQTVNTDEDTAVNITLTATDADNDDLTYAVLSGPSNGTLSGTAPNLVYTPGPNFSGTDSFTFAASDCVTQGTTGTVTINVASVNDAPELGSIGNQSVNEGSTLSFTATATDIDLPAQSLTYSLVGAPSGAGIDSGTGVFTWTPGEADGGQTFTFTVKVTDSGSPALSDEETITVTVNEVNSAPVLTNPGTQTVDEGQPVSVGLSATDSDDPAQTLSYTLVSGPSGLTLTGNTINWTTDETMGGQTFTVTVKVEDNGSPILSDTETFSIVVNEVNAAPVLAPIGNQSVDELVNLSFTASATDSDDPTNTLTYSLVGAPSGATINPSTGVFSWTPSEADGPGTFTFTVKVTDNGTPNLSDEEEITVTVNEVNVAPVLGSIGNQSVDELVSLSFTASATDSDLPANTLTYSLVGAPSGATINPSTGAFSWTPSETQGGQTFTFTVKVTDNGSPALSDEEEITVTVNEVNAAPVLGAIGNQSVGETVNLSFTASATDSDDPANTLTYSLVGAPSGATINPTTGAFSWTPSETQGGQTFTFTVKVTDNGSPALSDEEEITVTVNEVNVAPTLASIGSQTVQELNTLTFTAVGSDTDLPAQTLSYSLINAPAGASINPSTGVFTWTPTAAQGPATYNVTVRVTDDGSPNLYAEEIVTITVTQAPTGVSGTVVLEDYVPSIAGTPIVIKLVQGMTVVETINTTLDAGGNFNFTTNVQGMTDVVVKASHWLAKKVTVDLTPPTVTGLSYSLLNGDIDNNNEVGPSDFTVLVAAFGTEFGDPGYNIEADLDGDGEVGPSDFTILSKNFSELGD